MSADNTRRINKAGFTFIELVIAIAILGILALIAVPATLSYIRDAAVATTTTNLQLVKSEINHYFRNVKKYPDSLQDLVRKPGDIATKHQWGGPYFGNPEQENPEVPKDGWGNDFVYRAMPGNHPPFSIYSWGPNGADSPEDERIS